MSSIFRRKDRPGWVLKWRSPAGTWIRKAYRTRREAQLEQAKLEQNRTAAAAQGERITLTEYSARWLAEVRTGGLREGTLRNYSSHLYRQILPALGELRLRDITRTAVKAFLKAQLVGDPEHGVKPLGRKTVANVRQILHGILDEAREEGYIAENPAAFRSRRRGLRLTVTTAERALEARRKAFDAAQLHRFLETARRIRPRWWPLFRTMAFTGLRPGEAIALQWNDVNLERRVINVQRGRTRGRMEPTKTGLARDVDLGAELRELLTAWRAAAEPDVPWVFPGRGGRPRDQNDVEDAFREIAAAAGLPDHHTPHSLRHTYASLLLQAGESIHYVKEQLGHASIKITVDLYGSWLPAGNPACIDRLEARVAAAAAVTTAATNLPAVLDGGDESAATGRSPRSRRSLRVVGGRGE